MTAPRDHDAQAPRPMLAPSGGGRAAAFLDLAALRSGLDAGLPPRRLSDLAFAPGAPRLVSRLAQAGYLTVALTPLHAGDPPLERWRLAAMEARLLGVCGLDAVAFAAAGGDARRTSPGLFLTAALAHQIDLDRSAAILTSDALIADAREAGLSVIRLRPPGQENTPLAPGEAPSLRAAAATLLARSAGDEPLRSVLDHAADEEFERRGDALLEQRAPA